MKFNNTTNFILPIFMQDIVFEELREHDINVFDHLVKMGLENAYLNDYSFPMDNCVYLVFKNLKLNQEFLDFGATLEQHEHFVDSYDCQDGIVYVFSIPPEYKEDVRLCYIGKYSATSPRFKSLFPNKVRSAEGKLVFYNNWMILHKHPQFKKYMEEKLGSEIPNELDLWDPFDDSKEVYNYNKEYDSTSLYTK